MIDAQPSQMPLIQYSARPSTLYKIWVQNVFLKIITLGIYSFWGKTRLRKYMVSSFSLGGERFEYTGTGWELLKNSLKAGILFIIAFLPALFAILFALSFIAGFMVLLFAFLKSGNLDFIHNNPEDFINRAGTLIGQLIIIPLYSFLAVMCVAAIFSAIKYRISRIQWRGIRMCMEGSSLKYGIFFLKRGLINIMTLGFGIPKSDHLKTLLYVKGFHFGDKTSTFHGKFSTLKGINIRTLLLLIPTLGLSRIWYGAALLNYRFNHLKFEGMEFESNFKGKELFKLYAINTLLILVTLGIGYPYTRHRKFKFFAKNIKLKGDLNALKAKQGKSMGTLAGEGFENIFNLDTAVF